MKPLLILGTRPFAAELADVVSEVPGVNLAGFVENMEPSRCRQQLEGLPIYWIDDIANLADSHCAVVGLATTQRHRFVEQAAGFGISFATLIHPSARVSSKSSIGEGSIISAGVIVGARSQLGRHIVVNRGALIGHHTQIGDYTTVSPGANIAGACQIGERTYIGMSAIIVDHLSIGAGCFVTAGSLVTKDVPDRVKVAGVPAHVVKSDIEER
jgi:sugar O-acyltransferase (sialic acid O-acetyltransferase NeuD family)